MFDTVDDLRVHLPAVERRGEPGRLEVQPLAGQGSHAGSGDGQKSTTVGQGVLDNIDHGRHTARAAPRVVGTYNVTGRQPCGPWMGLDLLRRDAEFGGEREL